VVRLLLAVTPFTVAAVVLGAYLAVVTGRLTADPTMGHLAWFAGLTVASLVLGWVSTWLWRHLTALGQVRLRGQLLNAALHQPLPVLEEQAVGELLERTDSDPVSLFNTLRWLGQGVLSSALGAVAAWVTAGITWWPAWIAFPIIGTVAWLVSRGRTTQVRAASVELEAAWAADSAQFEETLAAADDLRTSGGQSFALRRAARRAARALQANVAMSWISNVIGVRLSVVLAAFTGLVVLGGVWAVTHEQIDTARFVTLFLLVGSFSGQFHSLVRVLPDIQESLGTLTRVRDLLGSPPEPSGGQHLAHLGDESRSGVDVVLRDLTFTYTAQAGDGFTLGPITLTVPAGQTLALVGRTGSGKSTLTKVLSRAVQPPVGTVFLDGVDVTDLDLEHLRSTVGVVGQRTEILTASLRDNLTLYQDVPPERITAAIDALGLGDWVASLPDGLDTVLGASGRKLSAGEEQLVAFARLLVRDVRVIVLDEATARMDPHTSHTVTQAARRLLTGRTGIIVAHRLATARPADQVAVLDHGRVVEHGTWAMLAAAGGRLAALIAADGSLVDGGAVDETLVEGGVVDGAPVVGGRLASLSSGPRTSDPEARTPGRAPHAGPPGVTGRGFWRQVRATAMSRPRWWVTSEVGSWLPGIIGTGGMLTALVWAAVITGLEAGRPPWGQAGVFVLAGLLVPFLYLVTSRPGALWFGEAILRLRLVILRGQLAHMPHGAPPVRRAASGEVTGRAMEGGRLIGYAGQVRDLGIGLLNVALLALVARSWLAAGLGAVVVAGYVATSLIGRRLLRRTAKRAREARAGFFRDLGSALDAARTIKLSGATRATLAYLRERDHRRVMDGIQEDRAEFVIDEIRTILSTAATLTAWYLLVVNVWPLATTLVVLTALGTYQWLGWSAAAVISHGASTRDWVDEARHLSGTEDLTALPTDTDLVAGTHTTPASTVHEAIEPLEELTLRHATVTHPDGTIGVSGVDLTVRRGQLVAVVGPVGSGKSSLLAALAGLTHLDGTVTWNGRGVPDPGALAGTRVAYVSQVPRVVSGTIGENVHLDHDRDTGYPLRVAQMDDDLTQAGGVRALIGHRGLRLSGGQTQRLALARALGVQADLLVLDDVSSALDAATEADLWNALTSGGATIVASTSRRATLLRADHVIVLDAGRQIDIGAWNALQRRWGHLAG